MALATEKGIELSFEEALRWIPHRLTKMRSHSFYRYFHHLKMLGWVEPTGEEEGSLLGGVPGAKVERTAEGTTVVEVPQICLHPTPERSGLCAFAAPALNKLMFRAMVVDSLRPWVYSLLREIQRCYFKMFKEEDGVTDRCARSTLVDNFLVKP